MGKLANGREKLTSRNSLSWAKIIANFFKDSWNQKKNLKKSRLCADSTGCTDTLLRLLEQSEAYTSTTKKLWNEQEIDIRRGGLVRRTILIPLSNTISAAIQFPGYVRNSPWSLRGRRLKLSCNVRNILTDTSPDRVLTISKMGRKLEQPTTSPQPISNSKKTFEQNTAGPPLLTSADVAL